MLCRLNKCAGNALSFQNVVVEAVRKNQMVAMSQRGTQKR